MDQKVLEVVLTSTGPMKSKMTAGVGWGEESCEVCLVGSVADIRVSRDGKSVFSLRILPDGRLILTSYQSGYETYVPQNLSLIPTRPWPATEAAEAEGKP